MNERDDADRLARIASEHGHQTQVRRMDARGGWFAVECIGCGHLVNPAYASAQVMEATCPYPALNDMQQGVLRRMRGDQYGDEPITVRDAGDGWFCMSGLVHIDKSRFPGYPHDYRHEVRYVNERGSEYGFDGMDYLRRREALPQWAKNKIEEVASQAVKLWMDGQQGDIDKYDDGTTGDYGLGAAVERYRELVEEAVASAIEQAFVRPLGEDDEPFPTFDDWSQGEAERAAEARLERAWG